MLFPHLLRQECGFCPNLLLWYIKFIEIWILNQPCKSISCMVFDPFYIPECGLLAFHSSFLHLILKRNRSVVLFSYDVFFWFLYEGKTNHIVLGGVSSPSILWKIL